MMMNHGKGRSIFLVLFTLFMSCILANAFAVPGQGSVQFALQGYGNLPGQLVNVTIQPDGTVSMTMKVNGNMATSSGSFAVTATGLWNGVAKGSALSGTIHDVSGQVQICVLACSNANFVGNGVWTGTMSNSEASGSLTGTITFTNSPYPQQLPPNQPIPITGTWNADLPHASTPPSNPAPPQSVTQSVPQLVVQPSTQHFNLQEFALPIAAVAIIGCLVAFLLLKNQKTIGSGGRTIGSKQGIIYCQHCGAQNPNSNKFCGQCGKEI